MQVEVLNTFRNESGAIAAAPWSFGICVAIAFVVAFAVMRILKAKEIGDLNSRLALRDDQISAHQKNIENLPKQFAQKPGASSRRPGRGTAAR
jgi:hypothetical protein